MKNILLNLGLKLSGKNIFPEFYALKSFEFNTLEENFKNQEKKLREILLHAWKYVPYYTKILNEKRVVIDGKVNLDNFSKIPVLSKDIIRNNFEDLKSKDPDYNSRKPYLNTSGGSTGEPIKFIQDKNVWTSIMANKWLFYSFVVKYPCRMVKLWGSERDILRGGYGFKAKIQNFVSRRMMLNSFRMSGTDIAKYVWKINKYKPEIIEAYVQSIYELSQFIRKNNLEVYSPRGIMTSAGTLYPEMKKNIEEVFRAEVFNRYGSREVGDIACSCSQNEGLHLNIFHHYFEILNDKLEPCKPGELGRVYVTTLNNFSMPLIRYDIGDIAISSEKQECSCGRGLPLITAIKGRDVNLFKTKNGELIDGEYFTHLFYMKDWVKKFQIVQKSYDLIVCKIILNKEKNERDIENINKSIKLVMDEHCIIKWEFVQKIESNVNGKYLYTISDII